MFQGTRNIPWEDFIPEDGKFWGDHGATFGPDTKVTNARIIRAWNRLKKVPVTIK